MAAKYIALLTQVGAAKLANATALGKILNITHMGVGDGGGNPTTPNLAQTALINEKRRAELTTLSVDPANPNQIIAEQIIPENEGGFWLREIGLYDADGDLIAVANCPETYKPQMQEGSGRVQTVRMILAVSQTDAVSLKIDPAVVLASRQYVDEQAIQVKVYVDNQLATHIAAVNPHKQYAPIESPALTGVPTAPTINSGNNSSQLATTAFVHNALADNAFALDFTGSVTNWDVPWDAKSGFYKVDLGTYSEAVLHFHGSSSNCSALQLAAHYGNRGLSYRTSRDNKGFENDWEQIYTTGFKPSPADIGAISVAELTGIPLPWPQASVPSGWLKCNGQAFDKNLYPRLAQVYPSGVLPDLRGEFIRGWDDGRGVDSNRSLLSLQGDAIRNITGFVSGAFVGFDGFQGAFFDTGSRFANTAASTGRANLNDDFAFDASRVVPTANENRPRNIAFNYIVRAA
ncbi:phage tail protein [Dickeya zeae]|nr:phage tail protein [Dickeya zeae]